MMHHPHSGLHSGLHRCRCFDIFCVSLPLQFRTRLRVQLNKHLQHQAAVFVSAALLFDYACLSATCFNYWLLMYSVAVTASNMILYPVKRLKRKTT